MQRINIIPNKLKREIKTRNIYISIKKIGFILLISTSIYVTILLISKKVLETHLAETTRQSSLITKTTQDYVQKVKDINSQIDEIIEIQKNNIEWSYLLNYLTKQSAKNNIIFSKITIDKNTNEIKLNGKSGTRDELLNFKESLESIKEFQDIEFPIKNLLDKENINFEISLTITNYEFSTL